MNRAAIDVAVTTSQAEVGDLRGKLVVMTAELAAGNPLTQEHIDRIGANVATIDAALQTLTSAAVADEEPPTDPKTLDEPVE